MNKKIKNAEKVSYNGINFRSKLEKNCYSVLIEKGIKPFYELKYAISKGFYPTVPFYCKNTLKSDRHFKGVTIISKRTIIDSRKVPDWNYNPDFYFEYNNYRIYIEVKGYHNDVSRYKIKLFRKLLENLQINNPQYKYEYWVVHSVTQLKECLKHITINNDEKGF